MSPALAPLSHWRLVLLALAEGEAVRAREQAKQMAAALSAMGPDAVPEHQINGALRSGKILVGHGDHDRVCPPGADYALLRRLQPFRARGACRLRQY
jgi:predicted esterase